MGVVIRHECISIINTLLFEKKNSPYILCDNIEMNCKALVLLINPNHIHQKREEGMALQCINSNIISYLSTIWIEKGRIAWIYSHHICQFLFYFEECLLQIHKFDKTKCLLYTADQKETCI